MMISHALLRLRTIRTRLVLSYVLVITVILVVVVFAVGAVHRRLGIARVDSDLVSAMQSVAGVVASEINERFSLEIGAHEALYELELPGLGVSVLDVKGGQLASRVSGAPALAPARQSEIVIGAPQTLDSERVRVAASSWQHREYAYRVVVWTSLAPLEREHTTVMNTVRIAIALAALAALAAMWLIVRPALHPLAVMAASADAIDRRHLQTRLPLPAPPDELRRLAVAFNGLLDRLSESITSQRRFMADASHELRTPVTVVRTAAQVTLSSAVRTDSEYREALEIIEVQTGRLTQIVDDLFLLALADVDGQEVVLRECYLDDVVSACVRDASVMAKARGVTIKVDSADDVAVRGDEELLRRMVMNLLDNAVRYGPEGSDVRVRVSSSDRLVTLTVEDSGPGIPEADRERVFERFVRLETARTAAGGGLGLPIARWIAEQHHGSLQLEPPVRGCRFVATLPLVRTRELAPK
jgi:two-component system, OmpR family, sensor kinase